MPYDTFAAARIVVAGANALAVYVGNGWPNISPNPFNGSTSALADVMPVDDSVATTGDELTPLAKARLEGTQARRLTDSTGAVRKLRAQLHVRGSDGSVTVFTTTASSFDDGTPRATSGGKRFKKGTGKSTGIKAVAPQWTCGAGALLYDDVYNGCTWNASAETLGEWWSWVCAAYSSPNCWRHLSLLLLLCLRLLVRLLRLQAGTCPGTCPPLAAAIG